MQYMQVVSGGSLAPLGDIFVSVIKLTPKTFHLMLLLYFALVFLIFKRPLYMCRYHLFVTSTCNKL